VERESLYERLRVFRASSTWSETGVTWANQPAKSGVGTTTVTVSPEGLFAWNVLAQTQEIYSSANHGFLIRDAAEDGTGAVQELHSREKPPIDNPPQLVITFSGS
jgi:hypothetical protein